MRPSHRLCPAPGRKQLGRDMLGKLRSRQTFSLSGHCGAQGSKGHHCRGNQGWILTTSHSLAQPDRLLAAAHNAGPPGGPASGAAGRGCAAGGLPNRVSCLVSLRLTAVSGGVVGSHSSSSRPCLLRAAGLTSTADDLFRSSFSEVYSAASLKGVPWQAVLGAYVLFPTPPPPFPPSSPSTPQSLKQACSAPLHRPCARAICQGVTHPSARGRLVVGPVFILRADSALPLLF